MCHPWQLISPSWAAHTEGKTGKKYNIFFIISFWESFMFHLWQLISPPWVAHSEGKNVKSFCNRRCRKEHSSTARPWWRKKWYCKVVCGGYCKWWKRGVVVIVSDWRCWFTFGVDDDGLVMVAEGNLTTASDSKYGKDYNVGAAPV